VGALAQLPALSWVHWAEKA